MIRNRVIPILLMLDGSLIKTINFKKFNYIGDPCNTVRIFNELEVDELIFLDIGASVNHIKPNYKILSEIASECFMPLSYGGGIHSLEDAKKVFDIGYEKISLNTSIIDNINIIESISNKYGSQAVICSIDVTTGLFNKRKIYNKLHRNVKNKDPLELAVECEKRGAGELLITSVNKEGTWKGFDTELIDDINKRVNIPIIAHGGAGKAEDVINLFKKTNVSGAGIGSLICFQKKNMGVLINFPSQLRELS